MKITFDLWSADEIFASYVEFVRQARGKSLEVRYSSKKYGLSETMTGTVSVNDMRLKDLQRRLRWVHTSHNLELQAEWKIKCRLSLFHDADADEHDFVALAFDDSLKKQVYKHFREFRPRTIR